MSTNSLSRLSDHSGCRWALALTFFAVTGVAEAQPVEGGGMTNEFSLGYSYSSESDLEHGGTIGEMSIHRYHVNYDGRMAVSDDLRVMAGVQWTYDELDLSGDVPLPDKLHGVSFPIGLRKDLESELGRGWSGTLLISPGFFAEDSSWTRSAFNAPGFIRIDNQASPTLGWGFGVLVNMKSRNEVLPVVGLRWNFAEDWLLTVGFPRTEVAYRLREDIMLRAGARYQGGSYRVYEARAPGLGDTDLDYREIRLGAGFDYQLTEALMLMLDAGVVVDREFDYDDRGYRLDGETAGYFSVGLGGRF